MLLSDRTVMSCAIPLSENFDTPNLKLILKTNESVSSCFIYHAFSTSIVVKDRIKDLES